MNSHLMQSLCQWITGRTNFGSQNSTDFGVRNRRLFVNGIPVPIFAMHRRSPGAGNSVLKGQVDRRPEYQYSRMRRGEYRMIGVGQRIGPVDAAVQMHRVGK